MCQFTEADDAAATLRYEHLIAEQGEAAAKEIPSAVMILDSSGTVRYCHAEAARLFRAGATALVGRHVRELIPDLPFDPRTRGYNVAYATFWSPNGLLRGFCGVDGRGCSFGLQLTLGRLVLEKHHQILLRLKTPAKSARLAQHYARPSSGVHARADRPRVPAVMV